MTIATFAWGLLGKKYTDPSEYDVSTLTGPYVRIVALPTDGTPFSPPRAIFCDNTTVADITDATGGVSTAFLLNQGENKLSLTAINNIQNVGTHALGAY